MMPAPESIIVAHGSPPILVMPPIDRKKCTGSLLGRLAATPVGGARCLCPYAMAVLMAILWLSGAVVDAAARPPPVVAAGRIDLYAWTPAADGPVALTGQWDFVWGRHLAPAAFGEGRVPAEAAFMKVPGAWNRHPVGGTRLPGQGAATYHLRVRLPPDPGPLALKILDMATACRLYANGRLVHQAGTPGLTKAATIPGYAPGIVSLPAVSGTLDIVCHVSNFHHWQGGAWEPILLGAPAPLHDRREQDLTLNFMIFGGLLIMGLYHMGLFCFRPVDRNPLLFGIFCLLIAVRSATTGERYLVQLWPHLSWTVMLQAVYLSFYACVPVFTYYVYGLFPRDVSVWSARIMAGLAAFFSLGAVLLPPALFTAGMPVYQGATLVVLAYGVATLVAAARRRRENALVFLAGFLILFLSTGNDILYSRQVIHSAYVAPYGLFLFIFVQTILLARRFSRAFGTVERQHQALQENKAAIEREIQEHKETSRALARSEKHYRTLFEGSMEALSLSHQGRIRDVNPAWLALHEYTRRNAVLGRDVLSFIHPDDQHMLGERRRSWPHHQARVYRLRDLRSDGSVVPVEVYSSGIALEEGLFVLATVRDISAQVQMEKDRAVLAARLQRAEKMEALGTLAGGVAHDLNNVLAGVVSYPDLILMDLPLDSPLRRPLATIRKAGQKAAAIVDDLLSLTRRNISLHKPVNLNEVITDYLESPDFIRLTDSHAAVTVQVDLAPALWPIQGSAVHLAKMVMNLVINAVEAMPAGGHLVIATVNVRDDPGFGIAEKSVRRPCVVRLRVSDQGTGIRAEDRERIYEPFFTRKAMGRSGTGLGMTVVWGTVQDHQGSIEVHSQPGDGTTFTIDFPVADPGLPAAAAEPAPDVIRGHGQTVLVVDDVAEQRDIAAAMLAQLGYVPRSAASGEAALAYLADSRVDLMLLDMIMDSGMDGLETYRQVLARHPGQRAVIVSGFSQTARVREALGLGPARYLKKPYLISDLARAVHDALAQAATPPDPHSLSSFLPGP